MTRLFRTPRPGFAGWAGLALFAAAYLSALALVLAPAELVTGLPHDTAQTATQNP